MNRSIPSAVIIPELPYPYVREAVDWLCETFGFTERLRIQAHRSQLQFGDSSLVIAQGGNSNPPVSVMVRVANVDAHYEHTAKAGTKIVVSLPIIPTESASTPWRTQAGIAGRSLKPSRMWTLPPGAVNFL